MTLTEREKMLSGDFYNSMDLGLLEDRKRAKSILAKFNAKFEDDNKSRMDTVEKLFGSIGGNCHIEAPFYCDYGYNIHLGENVYMNFNCVILDVMPVKIGNNVLFGPNVNVYAATHPTDPEIRKAGLEMGKPVNIGDNVWLGGNVTILPGVSIGNDTTVGAGSVITKDLPAKCVAAGNPCRILRML